MSIQEPHNPAVKVSPEATKVDPGEPTLTLHRLTAIEQRLTELNAGQAEILRILRIPETEATARQEREEENVGKLAEAYASGSLGHFSG